MLTKTLLQEIGQKVCKPLWVANSGRYVLEAGVNPGRIPKTVIPKVALDFLRIEFGRQNQITRVHSCEIVAQSVSKFRTVPEALDEIRN